MWLRMAAEVTKSAGKKAGKPGLWGSDRYVMKNVTYLRIQILVGSQGGRGGPRGSQRVPRGGPGVQIEAWGAR